MRKTLAFALALAASLPTLAQTEIENIVHRRCGTSMIQERLAQNPETRAISTAGNYVPHTGAITIPVILVNFTDVQFTINDPNRAFDQFFNGESQDSLGNGNERNHGSVAQYFRDMSGGDFNLSFKVYGPVTVDHAETYYGGKDEDSNGDENPRELVRDAVDKLQASADSITDISTMSSDGRTIDCVYIVYAGVGQNEGGPGTAVWANTWSPYTNTRIKGASIRWYSMAGELFPYKLNEAGNFSEDGTIPAINGIGVTCHELSHALGLPDIYPTSSSAYLDNQEMEYWDLMDGGEYSGNGYCPTAYTAFEKAEMGWQVTIETLTDNAAVTMATSTEQGGTAYKIQNPGNASEYFMLECIQKKGWNTSQSGNGLLVYHVNRPTGGLTSSTRFNNTPRYPGMAVVPADGACLSSYIDANGNYYRRSLRGDLFPGTGNMTPDTLDVTELSDDKPQPNFCWYNSRKTQKLPTNKALRNIQYDTESGKVSFYYVHDTTTGIKGITTTRRQDGNGRIYSIDGRYVGTDIDALPRGIYIINGKKVVKGTNTPKH